MKSYAILFAGLTCQVSAALAQTAATKPAAAASAGSFFQVLMGLIVVLGLMAGIVWILKRLNLTKIVGNAPVKVVGGVSVGSRERVIVVEVADQWIVVGVAAGVVNALSTLPRPEHVPGVATEPPAKQFSSWLKQQIDKRNGQAPQV